MRFDSRFFKKSLQGALLVFALATSLSAAPITFAQFDQQVGANDFVWTNTGAGGTLVGTTQVYFNYLNGLVPAVSPNTSATLTLTTGASNPAQLFSLGGGINLISLNLGPGSLSITENGSGANLLTAAFTGAAFSSLQGGQGATLTSSDPPLGLTFTSDYLMFGGTVSRTMSLGFSSVNPMLALDANNYLRSFSAAGVGTFSSDQIPNDTVPEPTTMGLMSIGGALGFVGLYFRKRRSS